ncbi:MAG: SDR family NAD(P)-dependent oxidoreductase [Legionellaceae bacterium]|nr:SDR family NAD(P)-dependent oxidoreductase [Legionellaceae bacterium]
MHINLGTRTALITGANQGIGRAIAERLLKSGANIVITSNKPDELKTLSQTLSETYPNRVFSIAGDLTIQADIEAIASTAIKHFGAVDILVNNAGLIGRVAAFESIATDEWEYLFRLNVMSGVNLTKYILPSMKANQWGRILFLSSEKGIDPGRYMSHYAMTKAALLSITKSLANELGQYGITANSIAPGVILTPAWDSAAQQENISREAYAGQFCRNVLPNQALGQPDDVASLACYLCSNEARWITGSNIRVDGGSVQSLAL